MPCISALFYMIRSWRVPMIVTSHFPTYESIILSENLNNKKKLTGWVTPTVKYTANVYRDLQVLYREIRVRGFQIYGDYMLPTIPAKISCKVKKKKI